MFLFFNEVDSIFLDYHWLQEWPGDDARIIEFVNAERRKRNQLVIRRKATGKKAREKVPSNVCVGIDVFGRGMPTSPGGFGLWRSLDCFVPRLNSGTATTGLAVSLFAPSWTWVALESGGSQDWEAWQRNERYFWTGEDHLGLPEAAKRERKRLFQEREERETGRQPQLRWPEYTINTEHHAIAEYKPVGPPPSTTIFLTTFGQASSSLDFRLEGQKVLPGPWTDWNFAFSQPNLIYPQPSLQFKSTGQISPRCEAQVDSRDSWLGGHCLRIILRNVLSDCDYTLPTMTVDIPCTEKHRSDGSLETTERFLST